MDLNKSRDFFNPDMVEKTIHIIGCGALGSTIAEQMARLGIKKIRLWDMDIVESHNIANQMFRQKDIYKQKVDALEEILLEINPNMQISKKEDGWNGELLNGFVFLCLDSIELRKKVCETNKDNPNIIALFDTRMGLTTGQHFATEWDDIKLKTNLIAGMDFTDEEVKEHTPVSACGFTLSIVPTIRYICSLTVANFMNYVKEGELQHTVQTDAFKFATAALQY